MIITKINVESESQQKFLLLKSVFHLDCLRHVSLMGGLTGKFVSAVIEAIKDIPIHEVRLAIALVTLAFFTIHYIFLDKKDGTSQNNEAGWHRSSFYVYAKSHRPSSRVGHRHC